MCLFSVPGSPVLSWWDVWESRESVQHGDTCENPQVHQKALVWVASLHAWQLLQLQCCWKSDLWKKALVFVQSCEQGLSQPHARQPVQSPSNLCLTALSRNLTAYGASPGLHSCTQEPARTFSKQCCLLFMAGAAPVLRFAGKTPSCKDAPKSPRDLLSFRHVHLCITELFISM